MSLGKKGDCIRFLFPSFLFLLSSFFFPSSQRDLLAQREESAGGPALSMGLQISLTLSVFALSVFESVSELCPIAQLASFFYLALHLFL